MSDFRGNTIIALPALLCFGILTLWVPAFWAAGVFQLGVLALGVVWMFALASGRRPVRLVPTLLPLGAAAAWPLLQLAANRTVERWDTWNSFWNWTVDWLIFFLALQAASDPAALRRFLKGSMYFAGALAAVGTLQSFTSAGKVFWFFPTGYSDLVFGPFVYQNQFAAFVEATLPIALYFSLIGKKRWPAACIAAVMAAAVIASASRAGTILVLAELVAVPILAIRMNLVSRRAGGAVLAKTGALAAAGVLVVGYGLVWGRFAEADPYVIRREVWISALNMIQARPGMGWGLGTWVTAYPQFAIFDPGLLINQAHSDWLQWAAEGGIPFLLLVLVTAALLVRPALRSVWGVGLLAVFLHALVDYPFQQRPALTAAFFALAGAVATVGQPAVRPIGKTSGPAGVRRDP
jgi:O-antigen ligase